LPGGCCPVTTLFPISILACPTDPGDGINEQQAATLTDYGVACDARTSTWHGTGVASLIAANANDGYGMAGIDWQAQILPVRAIGRCGGHRSDLLDAIRWAAGIDDPMLPPNPNPAHIINLSLGMDDICGIADQAAINDAVRAGAIVVSAVGNQGRNTAEEPSSPSQCDHVVGVLATDEQGYLAPYSNFGRDADIAAPGGLRFPSSYGVMVATNGGKYIENQQQTWKNVSGTSVAAPLVSGTLALMRSVRPDLSNIQLIEALYQSAASFPHTPDTRFDDPCTEDICGVGLLNAQYAVNRALSYEPDPNTSYEPVFYDGQPAQSVGKVIVGVSSFGCSLYSVAAANASEVSRDPSFVLLVLIAGISFLYRKCMRYKSNPNRELS